MTGRDGTAGSGETTNPLVAVVGDLVTSLETVVICVVGKAAGGYHVSFDSGWFPVVHAVGGVVDDYEIIVEV